MGDKVIAVDMGGTNMRVSLVQIKGKNRKILKFVKNPTPKTKEELVSQMIEMISEMIDPGVMGIGISSPGPLKDGVIKNPPNLPLRNFNLKKAIQDKFKRKVVVENDAKCVAIAESKLGCRKKNFIILTLGTGIGGGIIFDGKIYKGTGYGGEVGHIILDQGKDFETLAASKALKEMTLAAFGRELLITDLVNMKNSKADSILETVSMYLGQGIASLINVFDPEIVVISGGVKETGNIFLNRIRKQVRKYSVLPKETPIEWTKIEHPNVMGASLLIK